MKSKLFFVLGFVIPVAMMEKALISNTPNFLDVADQQQRGGCPTEFSPVTAVSLGKAYPKKWLV